jgi:cobalt-zinc-cadmium efflux system membrane fusion protein
MKRTAVWIGLAVLFSVTLTYSVLKMAGASARVVGKPTDRNAGKEGAEADREGGRAEIPGLKVEPVTIGEAWDVVVTTGRISPNANQSVKIGPRIGGRIGSVYANVSDVVHQGQVLASISSVELAQARAAYRQAQAKVKVAREAYDRQAKLADLGAFSKRPVEEARSEFLAAQGELAQAKSELVRGQSELVQRSTRLSRTQELYRDQIVSRQDLEEAEANAKRASAEVEATEAMVRQAEARVAIARAYLSREEQVLSGNHLASKELQAAKAELTIAQLDLRAAEDAIRVLGAAPAGSGDAVPIISPISGRVVARTTNLGEMAGPSDTLFTVMDLSEVWVEANAYEKDIARVRVGQIVEVKVDSYSGRLFSGRVTHLGEILDPVSRTARVRCALPNPSGLLKPEMFATITIITAKRRGAVLVPKEAVLDDAGKKIVFVPCMDCEEDKQAGKSICGKFDSRTVELGPAHDGQVEVRKGLSSDESLIVAGAYQLKASLGSGKLEAGCSD